MSVIELIDRAVSGRVLIFGSLPPEARDLDLLVRPDEERALASVLADAGFIPNRRTWARFTDCDVDAIDLIPADKWTLPAGEVEALFAEAVPVPGAERLVRPAPHHALLILARRVVREGRLDDKRRARLNAALDEDAGAWDGASSRAADWGASVALSALREAHRSERPIGSSQRTEALEQRYRSGRSRGAAKLKAIRTSLAPRRRVVIALSGLDGAGKSTQAAKLAASLERLGYETAVEWTRLSYNPSLDFFAKPIKKLLGLFGKRKTASSPPADDQGPRKPSPGKRLRRRSTLITHVWAVIVALANASSQRRATRTHLRAGRVVICDRYTLDSAVHLRYRYGERWRFRPQVWLIRLGSVKPLRAFWIALPPEEALRRKPEQYDLEQLTLQTRLYTEEFGDLSVIRLDGTRPPEELCDEIAKEVWAGLR